MNKVSGKLTVYFEEPFWVGVFEQFKESRVSVAKVTFGAEPKDYEVYAFILSNYYNLQFSSETVVAVTKEIKKNPKRMQREAKKQLQNIGVGTKSQKALKLQYEKNKQACKLKGKERKKAEAERIFRLKRQRKKEKHRGR